MYYPILIAKQTGFSCIKISDVGKFILIQLNAGISIGDLKEKSYMEDSPAWSLSPWVTEAEADINCMKLSAIPRIPNTWFTSKIS